MSKTAAGVILVAGPIVALLGGDISATANNQPSTPDTDWYYSMINGFGILLILAGLGMFFYGAMKFARKSA
jgi:hypothetical protein